jgi:hypothetical protein
MVYELPPAPDFSIAQSLDQSGADFGDDLRLEGVAFGGSSPHTTSTAEEVQQKALPSGKDGWVVLQWRALADLEADYKVAVYLLDSHGRVVGQTDKLLLSNYLETTSRWDAGQLEMDYYILSCRPATPPGKYTVQVAVYDASTMDRLSVFDTESGAYTSSIAIGELQVIKPLAPAEVQPQEQLPSSQVSIAPGLQLLGYDMPVRAASPGETVRVALYWRATEDVSRDYLVSLRLKDDHGEPLFVQQDRPVDGTYPTTEWDQGEVLRDWHDLALPADMPQGAYQIFVCISEEERLVREVVLDTIEVRGRARQFTMPQIQHPTEARLGEAVQFLGYDLSSNELAPGETLRLTLYWQALQEMEISYTVFTHLLDPRQRVWGQSDSIPGIGAMPTTSWLGGEVITDRYEIEVNSEAPPGEYTVEIGMYDADTGQRLPVYGDDQALEGDRLLLGVLQIAP